MQISTIFPKTFQQTKIYITPKVLTKSHQNLEKEYKSQQVFHDRPLKKKKKKRKDAREIKNAKISRETYQKKG